MASPGRHITGRKGSGERCEHLCSVFLGLSLQRKGLGWGGRSSKTLASSSVRRELPLEADGLSAALPGLLSVRGVGGGFRKAENSFLKVTWRFLLKSKESLC